MFIGLFTLFDYPISHSLVMAAVWSLLFAAIYCLIRGYTKGTCSA